MWRFSNDHISILKCVHQIYSKHILKFESETYVWSPFSYRIIAIYHPKESIWCHVFMGGSLWWVIIVTFLLLDDKSVMNAHMCGSLNILGSYHVFRKLVNAVYIYITWNLTETHSNPHTSKSSQPPRAWDGTKQWRNNPFTIYFLSNASIHLQLTCSSISRTVYLSWTMTLQELSDLWFQIPIDCTRGDSFHHQISQVLFSSSMLTRRPRTHFFLPLLLLLLCKWKPLTILALQALLYHVG